MSLKKILAAVIPVILVLTLQACFSNRTVIIDTENNAVVIEIIEGEDISGCSSLLEFMNKLKSDGKIDFVLDGTMVSEMAGVKNDPLSGSYWMLYTDDAGNSNSEWGTAQYNGKTYGSATAGASDLKIKVGCTYIWSYVKL